MELDKIKEKILKTEYELPLEFQSNDIYRDLNSFYQSYIGDLSPTLEQYEIEQLTQTCSAIIETIILYFNGYPEKAYKKFCERIPNAIESNSIFYEKSVTASDYIEPLKLYRIREVKDAGKSSYSRGDIFHVPYSKRREISTSRYSIAGYPCLYLGTNIELCRIETLRDAKRPGIASEFKLRRNYNENRIRIRVLDLGLKPVDIISKIEQEEQNQEAAITQYIMMYPIIAACSLRNKEHNTKHPFVPEYILPQLLMQWLRTKQSDDEMSGIRYFTSRSKSPNIKGYNYVFPVAQIVGLCNPEKEYCEILAKCFLFTNPIWFDDFTEPLEIEKRLLQTNFQGLME